MRAPPAHVQCPTARPTEEVLIWICVTELVASKALPSPPLGSADLSIRSTKHIRVVETSTHIHIGISAGVGTCTGIATGIAAYTSDAGGVCK